jgi:23S rRNA pseudouridine2605 synthase
MTAPTRRSATTTATTPEGARPIRLQKFLAGAGIAARREAERMILAGRVELNGRVVRELGTRIDPARDSVRVDGRRVRGGERPVYLLLNKPRGYITSASDPQGRPTILDLLPRLHERVFPVGRLDWNSEGLLILTNDGDLAHRLSHPAWHVPKVYRVKVKGIVPSSALEAVRRGLFLDGRRSLPARVTRISSQSNTWLEVTLYEGRRNQIRRMFERLGHPVLKLRRIAIGPIADRLLRPGEVRPLDPGEIRRLKEGR